MDKQFITTKAVHQVLSEYWGQYKKYPIQTIVAFFMPAVGTILVFFVPPLVVARIVNILAAGGEISLKSVGLYVAVFGGLWFLGEMLWRVGIHCLIKLEAIGIAELAKSAFRRLTERDYDFYTNNFVGSLTKKASGFTRGFETFTDTLTFNSVTNIFPIIFSVIVLWRYSPWIPLVLIFALTLAIAVGLPIVRRRSRLVAARHDAGSKVAGRISDTMTNMLAVKSFAKENAEQRTFGNYAD